MLRPEKMTRTVIVGSIDGIDDAVECLFQMGVLHLIDFTKQDQDFKLGQPLPKASGASQKLLKLRSIIRSLEIEDHKPRKSFSIPEIHSKLEQALVTLDLNTSGRLESRAKIQALIREKDAEVKSLTPVRSFGIPVENFDGYDNVSSLVGICKDDPESALVEKVPDLELFKETRKGQVMVAAFVRNEAKQEAVRVLSAHGFQEVRIPKLKGFPEDIIGRNTAEISDLEKDLIRIEGDLEAQRKSFADLIIASEEDLAIEVLKAETPLRIAESANSFVIDGWVPNSVVDELRVAMEERCCGKAFMEAVASDHSEDTPVKLKNAAPVKPFELLVNVVSTPKYHEVDPSIVIFIVFPIFFGFMLGDLGFGAGLIAAGLLTRYKFKDSPEFRKFGTIVLSGGITAAAFGLLVYGEAFGVPFHPPPATPDETSWASLVNIPLTPLIHKLSDTKEMLAISIVAGWMHLTLGLAIGVFNNRNSRKHMLGKIAWILILFGIFAETMVYADGATNTSRFFNSTVLAVVPDFTTKIVGTIVSVPAVIIAIIGIVALPFTEGPIAMSEILSMFSNLVSYARLAALAVGKGAMALAFNSMLLPVVFGGNIVFAVLGAVALGFSMLFFVFFLGSLSVGIQAIRLNYVEFFLKFFEGGGTEFSPLKYSRKYTVGTE